MTAVSLFLTMEKHRFLKTDTMEKHQLLKTDKLSIDKLYELNGEASTP